MLRNNTIVTIENPFDVSTRRITPVPFMPGRTVGELVALSGMDHAQAVVVKNGQTTDDLSAVLLPGDMVHVCPRMHDDAAGSLAMIALAAVAFYVVGPAATGYLSGAGFSAGAASFWGSAAALATVTVGGMLLNGMLAPAIPSYGEQSESPTYGWSAGRNTASEGIAIPVIVGHEATWPQVINQWIEVDGDDQWSHTLLCVGEGKTNNVPTSDDIKIDDQPITILPADSYSIATTDGGASPAAALANFEKLHQMRRVNKELVKATLSQALLHFNGTNGSTDIVDDGVGVADDPEATGDTEHVNAWTCHNTAALDTTHPFIGTAALNLETAGDYISCDEYLALDVWTRDAWDFEVRFRQDALTDGAIIGQQRIDAGGDSYYWGIFYTGGNIVFQQYKKDSSSVYSVYFNISAAASLSVDTWHHIRVARQTAYSGDTFSSATIYLFLDGTLLGSGNHTTEPEEPPAGTWEQTVGKAQHYTGSSDSTVYGNCELDELRLYCYGHLYDLASYTPPANQLADDGEQAFFTKGKVDAFTITVQCPYGLYKSNPDGSLENGQVGLWVSYRKTGATNWVRYFVQVWTASRNPVTRQWTFTPDAGRGQYEVRVSRLTWWNAEAFGYETLFQTTCYLMWVDEILSEALTYPHLQLLGVSIKAQDKLSGTIPATKVISNRNSITVPNYNGAGTRTVNPTNNAHCAFDMLTNTVYGPGIDPTRIIQADWEAWADWCDGLVDGQIRCQINMAFDQTYNLDESLQNVENCGRAQVLPRGTQLTAVIDKPTSAGHLFCPENITPGTNKTSYLRQAERSDAVEITYNDKDENFTAQTARAVSDGYNSLTRVARVTKLNLRGINNADQARREAVLRQQISQATKRAVSLQSGLEGIPVTVGDVFDHAHGGNTRAFTGRLTRGADRSEQYTGSGVYLDREITLDSAIFSGNCMLIVRDPDDTIRQYTVTGPFDTATRSITLSASGTFNFLSPYMILRSSGEIYQYRVTSMRRSSQKDVAVEGSQYVASAYYHSDYDGGATPI